MIIPINHELIELDVPAESAEAAIQKAGELLVQAGKVEASYVAAMIKGYQDVGPYIVLAPGIAIPHARPEHGVNEQCISVIRLEKEVVFGHPSNDPVRLVCSIGGVDSTSHIGMLQALSGILGNKEKLHVLLTTDNKEEFLSVF